MPDPFERRSRANGCCEGWYSQPSRSQLRSAAVDAGQDRAAKTGRGKKDPALCKAAHWKGPHQPELRIQEYGWRRTYVCNWILRHVASERYRAMTDGAIRYGLASAAADKAAGFSLPVTIMCATCGGGRTAGLPHKCRAS